MNNKTVLIGVILSCFATVLCAVGYRWYSTGRTPATYAEPTEKITIGTVNNETATLILIAEEMGYFRDSGLDVTIKGYQSGNFSIDDLLEKKIDVASCSEFALAERIFKTGRNLVSVGSYATVDNHEVIARKDRGITVPTDLKGKKIGVTFTSNAAFNLGMFLTFNGLSFDDVELVDLKPLDMREALAGGKIDALIVWYPTVWDIKAKMGDKVIAWPGQSGQPYYWLLVSTGDVIKARANAMNRLMEALARAEAFLNKNREEGKAIVGRRLDLDSAYLNYVWPKTKYVLSLDQALLFAMEDEARWLIKYNMSYNHKEVPDYLYHLYPDALCKAEPQAVRLLAAGNHGSN
jgi:NitT/TauT family transport system substrate-binding protein